MQEFEQNTETNSSTEGRMRAWLASVQASDTAVFQTVLEVAYSSVPQDTRTEVMASFPENLSPRERGMRWSQCVLGNLVLFAEQIEQEISYFEEGNNQIARELLTTDADLAAIMTTPELGDL